MFFKHVYQNAAKQRKNSGLFFGSLIIAIIAFYTLLSLSHQDVMHFLNTMEGHAIQKLMQLISVVYAISLFFVFFLVYFSYRYQLNRREKEFGIYLMLGMKRRILFLMLMTETLWNSLISIVIGLPLALLLTEIISLTTAKIIGLGIIKHQISFSLNAVIVTILGFLAVQIIAMFILSIKFSRKEPLALLKLAAPPKQKTLSKKQSWFSFLAGIFCLLLAYCLGLFLLKQFNLLYTFLIFGFGISGTFLLFRGMGKFIAHKIQKKAPTKSGLFTFTSRQIQENILHQHQTLAIASLLLILALSCVSFGIGVASARNAENQKTVDFSIEGSQQEIENFFTKKENSNLISSYYPMNLGNLDHKTHSFSWSGLVKALAEQPETGLQQNILLYFQQPNPPYLISETSYNAVLHSLGKAPLQLKPNQAALFTSINYTHDFVEVFHNALKSDPTIELAEKKYQLLPNMFFDSLVADRKITFYLALIVPDETYQNYVSDNTPFCWNVLLREDVVQKNGLVHAIQLLSEKLQQAGLEYESYLSGFGRNLFYTTATSYLTIYLGLLFILIANTVICLKYLIQQRTNKQRYVTLLMLGARKFDLYKSAKKQILLFFSLIFSVTLISSIFVIVSMLNSFLKLPANASLARVITWTAFSFILLIVIELIYVQIIIRISHKDIKNLKVTDRGHAN